MTTRAVGEAPGGWWRPVMWSVLAAVLLLPAVAMRFTPEVAWTASDFLFAGLLLGGLGATVELAMRFARSARTRALLIGGVLLAAALIWAEGAVGILR